MLVNIEIRVLRSEDCAAANALWCFMEGVVLRGNDNPESFSRFLERNPDCCYAAWQGSDLLVGAIMAGHDGRRGYLYHLAVKPGYRRQGIGRKLVEKSVAALHAQGISKFHVFVKRHNITASNFWKTLGWKLRKDIQLNSFSDH
jgi:ribosomal protein S18 acetylase RimI-like enzyme